MIYALCASCHTFSEENSGKDNILLKNVGFKFKHGAMAEFLQKPQKYNPQSRMPDFGLSEDEARALEAYIRTMVKTPAPVPLKGNVNNGKKLYKELNCISCHSVNGVDDEIKITTIKNISSGCLTGGKKTPIFKFKSTEREALKALFNSKESALSNFQPSEYAKRQIDNLKCLNCHTSDGVASNWKSPHNQPLDKLPSLTHAGEKIIGSYLKKILSGEAGKMRQWQKSRMPAFKSQAESLAMGMSHIHGFSTKDDNSSGDEAAGGKPLIGQTNFACVLCHNAGDTKALAPFGAPGPDLDLAGERLRYQYYMRWMLNPKRVEPSTHMTRFTLEGHKKTAVKAYNGDAVKQFNAIWDYMRELSEDK